MAVPFLEPLHVLGSGAIGLFWASSIRTSFPSYPVALLFRHHHRSRLKDAKTITVCTRQDGRPRIAEVPFQYLGTKYRSRIKTLVVATKANQAVDAVASVYQRLDPDRCRIILLCNGALDVRERIGTELQFTDGSPTFFTSVTSHGVYREDPDDDMFHVVQVGSGATYLESLPDVASLWDRAGLNTTSLESSQMEVLLWKKLAANCVCNPITSLWDVTNSQLSMDAAPFRSLRSQVVQEISLVACNQNPQLAQELSEKALDAFVESVIQANLQNKSSMFHDIQTRRQTEIDSLNGYVMRKGIAAGIETPANLELFQRISELSTAYQDEE